MPKKRLDKVPSFETTAAANSFVRPEDLLQVSMPEIEAAALTAACQTKDLLDLDIKEGIDLDVKEEGSEDECSPEGEWHRVLDSKSGAGDNGSTNFQSRVRLTLKLKKSKSSYGCDSCDAQFPSEKRLGMHKKHKHGSSSSSEGLRKESCDICGSEFQDIFRLSLHKRHKHLVQVPLPNAAENSGVDSDKEQSPVKVKNEYETGEVADGHLSCDLCSSRFPDEQSLGDHRRVTHKEGFEEHKIPCSFCGRTFNNHSKLKAHYDRHFKEKLKWSLKKSKGKQRKYRSSSKGGEEGKVNSEDGILHQCDLCGVSFPKEYRLRLHKRFKHLDERSTELVCELCGRGFKRPYSLKLHLMRHLGEKPFQCELCGKQAASSGDLKKHTILHTGVKPYKCTLCQKAFAYKNILTEHMNTHTGARPYLCDICGKAFSHYRTFGNHHRLHTGNTPYVCTLCGKKFAQLTGFNYHKKHHHNAMTSSSQGATVATTTMTTTTAATSKSIRDFFPPPNTTSLDFDKMLPSVDGGSSSSSSFAGNSSHHEESAIMNPFEMSTSLSSEIIDRIPSMKEETSAGVPVIPNLECALANLPEKMMRIGNMNNECERTMPVTNMNASFPHFPLLYPPFTGNMPFRHPY